MIADGGRNRISTGSSRWRQRGSLPLTVYEGGIAPWGRGSSGRGTGRLPAPVARVSLRHCFNLWKHPHRTAAPLPPPSSASQPASTPRISILRGMPSRKNPGHPGSGWARRFAAKLPPGIPPCRGLSNREAGYWFDALISAAGILEKIFCH